MISVLVNNQPMPSSSAANLPLLSRPSSGSRSIFKRRERLEVPAGLLSIADEVIE
jgi:hypothetical protein